MSKYWGGRPNYTDGGSTLTLICVTPIILMMKVRVRVAMMLCRWTWGVENMSVAKSDDYVERWSSESEDWEEKGDNDKSDSNSVTN